MALSYSWKQKIVAKSSTEAELVGVDDTLGYILWAHYFIKEHVYDMDQPVLYQDNTSAIMSETNGKASSTKRTKHIKAKYFYIKDKVDNGEVEIKDCPPGQRWKDINTKPKQGLVACFGAMSWGSPRTKTTKITKESFHPSPNQFDAAGAQSTQSIAGVCWREPKRDNTGQ
jgi:hypothetical protein